jgi:hypothetical protein
MFLKNSIGPSPQMNSNIKSIKEELDFVRFKKLFLLEFTRQLIKNSSSAGMSKLQTILEKENIVKVENSKDRIKEKIRIREEEISSRYEEDKNIGTRSIMHATIGMFESQGTPEVNLFKNAFKKEKSLPQPKTTKMLPGPFMTPVKQQQQMPPPQQRINQHDDPFRKLENWIPDSRLPPHIQYLKPIPVNKDIDLVKLNPLINDPKVKLIECEGEGQNIVVKGVMGVKKTPIILDKEEINDITQRFSRESKIPAQEGIFKVTAGRLILTAVISQTVGTKFIIKKMIPEEMNHGR